MAISAIGSDYQMTQGAKAQNVGKTSFSEYMALGTSAVTPVVEASFLSAGKVGAATISAAAGNAAYSSSVAAGGPSFLSTSAGLGGMGSSPYLSGGVSMSTGAAGAGGNVEDILSQTATSQAYLIGIQAQMGQQQSTFTAISNALNVKQGMERSAIQNFKA